QNITAFAAFQGVPMPWYPVQRAFRATLALGDGRVLPSRGAMPPGINLSRWLEQRNLHPRYDVAADLSTPIQLDQYKGDDIARARKNAAVRGTAEVELRRIVVLHEFPLQEGAVFTQETQRFTVRKVTYSQERLSVEIMREDINLLLRGENTGSRCIGRFVLINEPRHEYVEAAGSGMNGGFSAVNYAQAVEEVNYEPQRRTGRETPIRFTADWLRDARLLLIDSEIGGTLRIPFAFNSFDLIP
ncbi:MAG: hypothetical protein PHQ12_15025, partial [Chthoniobacteraceae bacterium]|nr:hypothetical protein [Chthoniobacteraceae bacterium]